MVLCTTNATENANLSGRFPAAPAAYLGLATCKGEATVAQINSDLAARFCTLLFECQLNSSPATMSAGGLGDLLKTCSA